MPKRMAILFMALLITGAIVMGLSAQPRPYGLKKAGCDTINDTVSVGIGFDAWYFYCWLDDSASGVGYLTTFWNGVAREDTAFAIRPGKDYITFAICDSIEFIKADSSDIFNYDAER